MSIGERDDGSAFRAALTELVDLLVVEESLPTVLSRVVTLSCSAIGACDLASITTRNQDAFETIVYTDQIADAIDQAQYAAGSGPCIDAFQRNEARSVPSMAEGDAWPEFRRSALANGVQSSFSLPMVAGEVRVGALNLYARSDHAFNSVPPDDALLFAKQAGAAIWGTRTLERTRDVVQHLETALESRDVIGMAKGIVMTNEKVNADDAFALLVRASQHRNVKLREIADGVVATGLTPV